MPWCGVHGGLQFSFRLKRFCSAGAVPYSSSFNGISFPGSVVGNTTFFTLSPSCVSLARHGERLHHWAAS